MDFIKFDSGNLCMVTGGRNTGRVGTIMHRERHPGSFDIVHVKDAAGHTFATRLAYIFVIGKGMKPYVSLPKGNGIKLSFAVMSALCGADDKIRIIDFADGLATMKGQATSFEVQQLMFAVKQLERKVTK